MWQLQDVRLQYVNFHVGLVSFVSKLLLIRWCVRINLLMHEDEDKVSLLTRLLYHVEACLFTQQDNDRF